jgi:hypothetical protein
MDTKANRCPKTVPQANTNPEQLSLPREMNCSRPNSHQYRLSPLSLIGVDGEGVLLHTATAIK